MCAEAVTARKTATRWQRATNRCSSRTARRVVTATHKGSKLWKSDVRWEPRARVASCGWWPDPKAPGASPRL